MSTTAEFEALKGNMARAFDRLGRGLDDLDRLRGDIDGARELLAADVVDADASRAAMRLIQRGREEERAQIAAYVRDHGHASWAASIEERRHWGGFYGPLGEEKPV